MQGGPHDQSLPLFGKTKTLVRTKINKSNWNWICFAVHRLGDKI